MFFIGGRVVPWLLTQVARSGSRELFTLAVLAVALGVAVGSAALFSVSLALGAFFAGLVVGESDQSHQAAADALPLRDAFAVLFFVSVGMLFDPAFLLTSPIRLLVVLLIVVLGKALVAFLIVVALKYPVHTGLVVAAGLAQVGEFSFILGGLGLTLKLLPAEGYNLILVAALLSISLNPLLFRAIAPIEAWLQARPRLWALLDGRNKQPTALAVQTDDHELRDHAIVCGYGRVGEIVGGALQRRGFPYIVVEYDQRMVERLQKQGINAAWGDASNRTILEHAGLADARLIVVATGDWLVNQQIVEHSQQGSPNAALVARAHRWKELDTLRRMGADEVTMGEIELAIEMSRYALETFGAHGEEVSETLRSMRELAELHPSVSLLDATE